MRTFAIGDIHGNYKALMQCLKGVKFDYAEDELICLGDVCDGFPFVKECFDELLKIKKLIYIMGNHDDFALQWYDREWPQIPSLPDTLWTRQGGMNTLRSYGGAEGAWNPMTPEHLDLLTKKANYVYVDEKNRLFVHGGIDPKKDLCFQTTTCCMWDRHLIESAWTTHKQNPNHKYSTYDTIFVGHTTTQIFRKFKKRHDGSYEETYDPIFACNVIDLDTGAGWDGKLTIMNVDTKEYFQSDKARELYPDTEGRTSRLKWKEEKNNDNK